MEPGNQVLPRPRRCVPPASPFQTARCLGVLLFAGTVATTVVAQRAPEAQALNPAVTVRVDAGANRKSINPEIYGVALATPQQLAELNAPLNRYGGNNATRYNWQLNADNRGFDWYFQSIAEASATPGERGDRFIQESRTGGAQPMLTVPTIGWVAKLGANRSKLASFSIAKYGAQTDRDWQWFPDAGNGIRSSDGQEIQNNDPNDANVAVTPAFQQDWVRQIVGRWGGSANGGLRYYVLDNEPSIWHATHRDVRKTGVTMEQVRDYILDYSARIKAVDPNAQVVGPEEWGWSGYLLSGYDQQWGAKNGWGNLPDRAAHGGMEYLPWLLDQLRQRDAVTGKRSLDVFTVHYYPQGGEFSNDTSATMQLRRNRSTRSLWDPAYTDESWIGDKVRLVPRLKGWVDTYYPGLKTGITEYNWGAEGHINGATTQADIYGIFGREGLDMGARWTTPDAGTPTFKAMKLFRNCDGQKNGFGDVSVGTVAPNPDQLSAFGALRTGEDALTVMVVNKVLANSTPVTVSLANYAAAGSVEAYQLTAANTINRLPDGAYSGGSYTLAVPPQSVTLLVLRGNGGTPPPPPPPPPADPVFTTSASVSPASVVAGSAVTVNASVACTAGQLSNGIVDVEVYNSAGTKVGQNVWSAQSFTAGGPKSYSFQWTGQTAGTYTVKVGVFTGDWTTNWHWNNAAATFTVTAPPVTTTFSSSAGVTPNPVAKGKNATIKASVTCTSAFSNAIVDVEIYNSAGAKVAQNFWSGQNFTANTAKSYSFAWSTRTAGTYTVKVGVFTANWTSNPHWNWSAATFKVQ